MLVFNISYPRVGTTSLHTFLEAHGLKCLRIDTLLRDTFAFAKPLRWDNVKTHDVLGDVPYPLPEIYTLAYLKYPGAKFILFERYIEDWLRSIEALWNVNCVREGAWYFDENPNPNLAINQSLYGSAVFGRETWARSYTNRMAFAKEFFADKQDCFLYLSLYEDNNVKADKICEFLGLEKKTHFPHENLRSIGPTQIW